MTKFTAEGGTYPEACKLIAQLDRAGIEANITAGGVAIYPEPQQIQIMMELCKANNFLCCGGHSSHQESILLQSQEGYDAAKNATLNANAVIQEWSDE